MIDPYRLAISVTHADGVLTRWGPDDVSSRNVPTGLSFSTSIPGGFKDMSCSLLRELTVDYADEALFDNVRIYGPGNETAWEGRIVQFPRQHADQFSVQPGAVGWSAHLQDDTSFREIYVDRDLTQWRGPSVQRQIDQANLGAGLQGCEATADTTTGFPSLVTSITGPWTTANYSEGWYDSSGIQIGSLYYAWKKGNDPSQADTNWHWHANIADGDGGTLVVDSSGELRAAGPGSGTVTAGTGVKRFAMVTLNYGATGGANGFVYRINWTCLAAYGTHGLAKRGTNSATDAQGFYASDVIANIVSRTAPLLTYTTGLDGSISPTTFVIPQLAFLDPTTGADAISIINGYHLYEWGVYDNREFFWRPPNPDRLTWEARLSDGAQVSLEGDDANNIFNGVFITYQDPAGKKSTAGPPNSGADTTDSALEDDSDTNPVNAHGIPRRWGRLEISQPCTPAAAVQLGSVWLAEHSLPSRRGQLTLTGTVDHPTQGKRPVWAVRAGDYIRLADRPNDAIRRIIETSYDHDQRRLTASLDNTVFRLDALLERIGIGLVGVL
jgi:hypothetical protein